jgi:hypothetical protein
VWKDGKAGWIRIRTVGGLGLINPNDSSTARMLFSTYLISIKIEQHPGKNG